MPHLTPFIELPHVVEKMVLVMCFGRNTCSYMLWKGIVFSITCHRRSVQNQFRQPINGKLYLTNFLVLARFIYYGHLSTCCPLNSKSSSSQHLYHLIVELFILVNYMAFFLWYLLKSLLVNPSSQLPFSYPVTTNFYKSHLETPLSSSDFQSLMYLQFCCL